MAGEDGIEQLATQIRRYMEFARRVMRRWWLVGLLTVIGATASVATALLMTRYYESRTMISYKEAVNKAVLNPEELHRDENWLRTQLDETFSSHTLRMKIIKDLNLFPGMRQSVAPEVLLEEFSRKVQYDMVGSDSFWISFEYKDPRKAQQGATRLAKEFINKHITDNLYAAQTTLSFMKREVNKAKADMDKIEGAMAEFVSDNPEYQIDPATGLPRGILPTAIGSHSYASVRNPELRRALARKGQLEARLQLMLNPQSNSRVVQIRQQFERARQRLLALRRQYTDRHPDVQRARAYARQMQIQLNAMMQSHRGDTGQTGAIRGEISSLDRTIARLSRRRQRRDQPARPKRALSQKAALEKRFYQLSRDRAVVKAKYEQLQTQLQRSRVSANLEGRQAETQFTIVDKANLPRKPSRPSRTKLALAGTALGLMLGLGLAVLLVIFDPRIYSEDDLKKACDLPVLAQIPREA